MSRAVWILLVLGGCAAPAVPATRIVTMTPEVPPALLGCAAAPEVPAASDQSEVAQYVVALWRAGQDCRAHVAAIKSVLDK
jgi:hypothetical protein